MAAGGSSLGAINLGTRDGASVREVLDAVERVTGTRCPWSIRARRPGDPAILVADATTARDVLGWAADAIDLDEMVASAWSWRQRFRVIRTTN